MRYADPEKDQRELSSRKLHSKLEDMRKRDMDARYTAPHQNLSFICRKCRILVPHTDTRDPYLQRRHPLPEPYMFQKLCPRCFKEDNPKLSATLQEMWLRELKKGGWTLAGYIGARRTCTNCKGSGEEQNSYICRLCDGRKEEVIRWWDLSEDDKEPFFERFQGETPWNNYWGDTKEADGEFIFPEWYEELVETL